MYQRKPMRAPANAEAKIARFLSPCLKATRHMIIMTTKAQPPARPSRPSVRLTALERPAMSRNTKKT